MPTGYTAALVQEGQGFKDFALTCARAFGPCIDLRDEALYPAPKTIKKDGYHEKQLKEERLELEKLLKMTTKQKEAYGAKKRGEELGQSEKALENALKENERLDNMSKKVSKWNPPTSEHVNLKNFMLDQLKISRSNSMDYYVADIEKIKKQSDIDRYNHEVLVVKDLIKYHEKGVKEEGERSLLKMIG